MNVHGQPGVFAVLLGSGVSTAAGIPTGWQVVQELVGRAATAAGAPPDAVGRARADPEQWWAANHDGQQLGYSSLLAGLAPSSQAARRGLIKGFFETDPADTDAAAKVPTAAHRAIAALVKDGYLRVVVTTNFDRLMERALDEAGVLPQVIATDAAVHGMTPLQHAPATVIKVNGDWADLDMRNTVEELATYTKPMNRLLRRVFEEYGLIISGWSADWDLALRSEVVRTAARRYPLYWDTRSSTGDAARRILASRGGSAVPADSADDLFTALEDRVRALESIAQPPTSTAMLVARLKRLLPDPIKRIELSDLVLDATAPVAEAITTGPSAWSNEPGFLDQLMADYRSVAAPLVELVAAGISHDSERQHTHVWNEVIQRLLDARTQPSGTFTREVDDLRYYPALMVLRAAGIAALRRGDDQLLVDLLTIPTAYRHVGIPARRNAADLLNPLDVIDRDLILNLARFDGNRYYYPWSVVLREDLREPMRTLIPSDADYQRLSVRFEYRMAVVEWADGEGVMLTSTGEFLGEYALRQTPPWFEQDLRDDIAKADLNGPWERLLGKDFDTKLTQFTETMKQIRPGR